MILKSHPSWVCGLKLLVVDGGPSDTQRLIFVFRQVDVKTYTASVRIIKDTVNGDLSLILADREALCQFLQSLEAASLLHCL